MQSNPWDSDPGKVLLKGFSDVSAGTFPKGSSFVGAEKPGYLVCQTWATGWEAVEGAGRPAVPAASPRHLGRSPGLEPHPRCQVHLDNQGCAPAARCEPEAEAPRPLRGPGTARRPPPSKAPRSRKAHGRGAHRPEGGRARGAVSLRMRRRRRRVGGWGGPAAPTPFIWPLRRRRQPDLRAKLCAKLRRAGGGLGLGPATRSSAEPRAAPPPADPHPPAGRAPRRPEDMPLRRSPGPHLDIASQSRGGRCKPKQQQDKKLAGGRSGRGPSGRHPSPGSCGAGGAGLSRSHARSDQSAFRTATQKHLKPVRRRPGGFTPTGTDFTKPRPSSAGSNTNPHNWPKMPPFAQPRSNQGMDAPAPLPAQSAPPHGPAPISGQPRPRSGPEAGGRTSVPGAGCGLLLLGQEAPVRLPSVWLCFIRPQPRDSSKPHSPTPAGYFPYSFGYRPLWGVLEMF